ncbi:hypothetical protein ASPSYDRAFT_33049 [Aspergillus sydowii CBS 593.65]|uniref:Uncharacterized protein n=1 Tax=Aspergillus sydowii CBS 593.65 TaxID=1036612 RepID=A0A1L9TBS8_9EURO|nr:uncharacterized protein ASPSYDRAFT_33049 [Aspergillus sydowii CBS 593.65]OJJ56889.1 hypothetical protein ASPSYDRAFT_33049 [Aspergillus sydowii CBS 593.65]
MRVQTLTTLLLLPLATIVAGADGDPPGPGDRPSNGDQCANCESKKISALAAAAGLPMQRRYAHHYPSVLADNPHDIANYDRNWNGKVLPGAEDLSSNSELDILYWKGSLSTR